MKNLSVSQLQPMAGYVLVEPAKAETKTASGIILPESEGEKPQYGVVLAVGAPECNCDDCGCGSCGCGSCGCGEGGCGCGDNCGCGDEHEHHHEHEHDHEHKHDAKTEKHDHDHEKSEACDCGDCECDCGCGEAPVSVGDQVIYKKWGGNEVAIDDVEYQFLKFEDILAVIKKK